MEYYKIIKGTIFSITYREEVPYITVTIRDNNDKFVKCYIDEGIFFKRSDEADIHADFYIGDKKRHVNPTPVSKYCVGIYKEKDNEDTPSIVLTDIIIENDNHSLRYINQAIELVPDCLVLADKENMIASIGDYAFKLCVNMEYATITDKMKVKLFESSLFNKPVIFLTDYDGMCYKMIF